MNTADLKNITPPMTREEGLLKISRRYGINLEEAAKAESEKLIIAAIKAVEEMNRDKQSPETFVRSCLRWLLLYIYHEGRRTGKPQSVPIPSFEYATFRNSWKLWQSVKLPYDFQYEERFYRLQTRHTGTVVDAYYIDPNGHYLPIPESKENNVFTGTGTNQYDALKTLYHQLTSHGINFNF